MGPPVDHATGPPALARSERYVRSLTANAWEYHVSKFDEYPTVWPIEPQTEAKHEILRKYLAAWFPIMSSWQERIIFIDGFAGPGVYEGGEPAP